MKETDELHRLSDLIVSLTNEITDRYNSIIKIFPQENEELLRHLAAASIHTALFFRDIAIYLHKFSKDGSNINEDELKIFYNACGCDLFN